MVHTRNLLVCLLVGLLCATAAWAQLEAVNARLTGTILDPNSAAVPGAKVTLASTETGFVRQFTTGTDGRYVFTLIPPGRYELRVEKEGFSAAVQSNIQLTVGQSSTLDMQLQVGAVSQTVEVQAAAPLLNTGNSDIATEVTTKQVVELPLNIRNVYGLVSLDSSVNNSQQNQALNPPGSQGNVDQDIAFFNFGGGRFGTTAFLLDGHWGGAGDWAGVIFVPSVDETQEFRIQTHTFSPQYGWSMGNVVNAITKSGTSSFHGGAFEFLRNDNLDANNFFNNRNRLPRPEFKRSQFGVNAGGPLYIPGLYRQTTKTFIFGAYEGLRQQTPTTLITSVPTALQRQGDFSQTFNPNGSLAVIYNPFTTRLENGVYTRTPFQGNRIPSEMLDRVGINLLKYWPAPNRPGDPLTGLNNFVGTAGLPTNSDQYTIKGDHVINDNQRLFLRWSQKRQFKQLRGEFFGSDNPGGMGTIAPNPRFDAGFGYTNAFTPTFVMSATLGFGRWAEGRKPQGVPFQVSSLGLPTALDGFGGPGAFPSVSVTGYEPLGSGVLNATPREARTFAVDFTNIRGRHTLTMGFTAIDFRLNTFNSSQANFSFGPAFTQGPNPNLADPNTGNSVASMLLGAGGGTGITINARASFNKNFFAWYFNDDWKIRPNLTLNLGVRYDFQTAPTDRFDRLSYWTLDRNSISDRVGMNLIGGIRYTGDSNPRGIYDPQMTNIAPRIGLTYSPRQKLVMRAGYGMFYLPAIEFGDYQGLSLNGFTQNTPFVGSIDGITPSSLLSNPFPQGLLLPPEKAAGDQTNVGLGVNAIERDRPTPYVQQWMFGLQYELLEDTVFEAVYVGNHGVKLPFNASFQRNQLDPKYLSMGNALLEQVPNPFFGIIRTGQLSGPTIARGQLLRPYPHFTSVTAAQPPAGMSNYNAFSLSARRRFSNGFHFLVSFTASKYLTNTEGAEGWTNGTAQNVRNWYDIASEKSLMINDIPRSLVASYIYELPVGTGKKIAPSNKVVEAVIGGWQVAGVSTFKSGFPLAISAATNNTNSFGGNQRPNVLRDPTLDTPDIERWFDTGAFAQPAAFTFGNTPRTLPRTRSHGTNNFDITIQKYWTIHEETRLQFRTEMFNAFNRTGFYAPNTQFGNANFGKVTGALPARSIQMGLKLYW